MPESLRTSTPGATRLGIQPTINVEKFASYEGDDKDTTRATYFEQNDDLTVVLKRGEHPDVHVGSQDGIVLIRLAIDDYDGVAVVELEPSHSQGNDNLATAEAALAHLQVVCDRLLAFADMEAKS